jgi:hypothetical protein
MFTARGAQALLMGLACTCTMAGCGASLPPPVVPSVSAPSPPPIATDPARSPAVAAAVSTASLSGTILDEQTRAALPRARVTLTSSSLSKPRATISAADGTFRFDRLPAGSYAIAVSRSGYVPSEHQERRSGPAAPVVLGDGQHSSGLEIAVGRAGVIHGQILDEDGQPFTGAVVDALVSRLEEGQATLISIASTETDDRGEFRLPGLPAGQYYVSAIDPAFADIADDTGPLRYTATYYPGVTFADEATRIRVMPGSVPVQKLIFKLQILKPSRVLGRMTAQDGRQLLSGAVIMSAVDGEGFSALPSHDVVIHSDGRFEFRNVPPGRYQIRARGNTGRNGAALLATFQVVVQGEDVRGISLVLVPGANLQGTVEAETLRPSKPSLAGLRVRAPFADGTSFGDTVTGDVSQDGSFSVHGLMSGTHVITVEGLQHPWVLERVTHRGTDVSDTGIEIGNRQDIRDVRVIITDAAAEIAGTVRNARGAAVADATVIFVPLGQQFWTRTSRRLGLLRADAEGRYRLRGLPPGEYRAVASTELDETEVFHRDVLEDLSKVGVPLTLQPLEARVLDLPLTSMAARQ